MNQIDRLMIKAKRLAAGSMEMCVTMITQKGNRWTSLAHLWGSNKTSAIDEAEHHTLESAVDYVHALAEKCLNSQDVPIIIIDV